MNLEQIKNQRIKMILQFSIPSVIAMVLTSLITVADGFFIGNYVGREGLAAVNLGMPIVYLFLAIGLMISVGGIAIAGMAFGGGDLKKCNDTFNQTIVTVIIITITISVLMRFCLDPMLGILKVDRQLAARYFKEYYSIMLLQFPIMVVNTSLGMFIRGEGKPQYFMQVNIFTYCLIFFWTTYLLDGLAGVYLELQQLP